MKPKKSCEIKTNQHEYWKYLRNNIGNGQIILPGAFAIIKNKNEILLVKSQESGLWTLIGGLQNLDESILETLDRELTEELDIKLEKTQERNLIAILTSPKWITKLSNGDIIQPHAHLYEVNVEYININNIRSYEIIDAQFFDIDKLPNKMNKAAYEMINIYKKFDGKVYVD